MSGCGGKSGSDVDDDDGSSSGGTTSGSSGGATSGSGGTSDSSGSTSTGGSGGSAAQATSTASTGGTGGSGGATSGSGGTSSASGGSGGGSTVSTTGSVNPSPPQELVEGCEQVCEAEVASGCASAPTADACAGSCALITRVQACADAAGSFFDCVAEDDTTSCSDEGDVVFDGCVSEQLQAVACIFQEAPDDSLEEPCEQLCAAEADADCEVSSDLAGCVLGCQAVPTIVPSCDASWRSFVTCAQDADYSCDEAGEAQVEGCDAEALVFLACAYPELNP